MLVYFSLRLRLFMLVLGRQFLWGLQHFQLALLIYIPKNPPKLKSSIPGSPFDDDDDEEDLADRLTAEDAYWFPVVIAAFLHYVFKLNKFLGSLDLWSLVDCTWSSSI